MTAAPIGGFSPIIQQRFDDRSYRQGQQDIVTYFEKVADGNLDLPTQTGQKYLSAVLDQATQNAFNNLKDVVTASPEHERRVAVLRGQPRLVGKVRESSRQSLFANVSPFEQMLAVEEWLNNSAIREIHTFRLANGTEDYIPVRIKNRNLMEIVLGDTTGSRKAPRYEDWAVTDPWTTPSQKRFIYPLEGLEIVRQPAFSSATVFKGNAFEHEFINQDWRYGLAEACVEEPNQRRNSPRKLASAGLNLTSLNSHLSDESEPTGAEISITLERKFADYSPDGYKDEAPIFDISPKKLLGSAKKAILEQNVTDVDDLCLRMLVAKIGPVSTPSLKQHIARTVFDQE